MAVLGLGATLKEDFAKVRTVEYVATDYKTLYASAVLFREGGNPFSTPQIVTMYKQSGVDLPKNMFGHMPVYPPVTLLALWPFTYLSMAHSAVAWLLCSLLAAGAAVSMVLSEARAQKLHWAARMLLLGFAVGAPVLGYALDIGNVSPLVGALATISLLIAVRESNSARRPNWLSLVAGAASLGAALCLKPHLAIWILVGIALMCGRFGRVMGGFAMGIFAFGNLGSALILWNRGALRLVLDSFLAVLKSERGSGSMAPSSREILYVMSQITGLDSLLALWMQPLWRDVVIAAILVTLLSVLLVAAKRNGWMSKDRNWQILFVTALFGVGMMVSYHRAHDAVILQELLGLWLCHAVRSVTGRRAPTPVRRACRAGIIAVLVLLIGSWFDIPASAAANIATGLHAPALRELLTLRQGALFAAAMAIVLVVLTWTTGPTRKKTARTFYCPCREASDATCVGRGLLPSPIRKYVER